MNGRYIINCTGLGWFVFESVSAKISRALVEEQGFGMVHFKGRKYSSNLQMAEKNLAILVEMVTERTGTLPYVMASSAAALPASSLAASEPYKVFQAMVFINPVPSMRHGVASLFWGIGRYLLPLYEREKLGVRAEVAGQAILVGMAVNPGGPAAPVLQKAIQTRPLDVIASEASSGFWQTPMIFILGGKDGNLPPDYAGFVAGFAPHARIESFNNLNHGLSTGFVQTLRSRIPGYVPSQVGPIAAEIGNYLMAAAK